MGVLLFVTFFSKERERYYLWDSQLVKNSLTLGSQLVKKPSLSQECLTIVHSLSTHEIFIMSSMEWIKEELEVDGTSSASEQ